MIISRKKYEKLNDDLIDAKTKVDDAKKSLDEENKIMRATLLIKKQRDQYKAERDTLIDDLSWYKAKVSRLEREIKEFDKDYEMVTNNCIYWEDKAHWLEDGISKCNDLLSEISQHIGNKPSSSTYKYFRAKLDALEIKEGE